jgi:hypothetical protein
MMRSRFCAAISCSSFDLFSAIERTTLITKHARRASVARKLAAAMTLPASGEVIETAAPILIDVSRCALIEPLHRVLSSYFLGAVDIEIQQQHVHFNGQSRRT